MSYAGSAGSVLSLEPGGAYWTLSPDAGLIRSFLSEQGDLSAVERFVQFHEDVEEPLQGRYYSALMPAHPPGPGQQLAFEVDLDRCSGCKACVAACHNLNGLDEGEWWRDVGLVVGGMPELPVLQHVTSACHHCLDPACMNACPVDAYEKDPHTGIVRHLDDQCIGCQYCTLACPYDAPKYNASKGIVRKCDMCHARLAVGEAPACVQACPHEAIRIRVVDDADVIARAETGAFLPATLDPTYTLPSTHFRTSHLMGPGDMQPADDHHLEPEHAHWPLIAMLVLTQLSVGGFVVELLALAAGATGGLGAELQMILSLGFGWAGLGASVLHLGRPLYAYRALIGIRHSWLSREVLAFGLFAKLATAYAALAVLSPAWFASAWGMRAGLLGLVVLCGSAGLACSVLVYHVVRRPFWHASFGGVKFAGTAIVLGLAVALAALGIASMLDPAMLRGAEFQRPLTLIALSLMAAMSAKLWIEARLARGFAGSELAALRKTGLLLGGPLQRPARLRRLFGVVGGVVLPAAAVLGATWASPGATAVAAALALVFSISGELIERYLFFTAVVKPKMPGGAMP
ncbi:MAG: DmsC/YnfH family molybdoenzyme membrane anchor subunit [Isosphaeraceae bacterium]